MKARLILVAGKADKGEVRLKLPTIIGRTREAGLMIAHKTVSRRHCELFERHGMLYVRDSGSLNGTLVDDAPIKESMLKPGHTVTVGPLTFRAEYEPADAFLGGDDDALNGVADTATGQSGVGGSNRTAAAPTFNGEFDAGHDAVDSAASAEIQNGAAEEVLDFGSEEPADDLALDFGGDETLSMQITEETTDLQSLESPEGMPALESAEFDASEFTPNDPTSEGPATVEDDLDLAFSLDEVDSPVSEAVHVESSDDLALDFEESTDFAAPQAALAEPAVSESAEFDLDLGGDPNPEPAAGAAEIDNLLPAAGEGDDLAFDFLAEDSPAAAAPSESPEFASSDDGEFSLAGDDDELDFGATEPAPAAAGGDDFDLGEDDGGTFNLADDSAPAPSAESANSAEADPLDFGSEEEVTFDLSDGTEETVAEDKAAKPAAGKKKPADEDDEMSDFLKELGM
jgi:hypothetical protein